MTERRPRDVTRRRLLDIICVLASILVGALIARVTQAKSRNQANMIEAARSDATR